jgi:hypothetical protein
MTSRLEKFIFKKVELWILLLGLVLFFVTTVLFGHVVRERTMGSNIGGTLGWMAAKLARTPSLVIKVFSQFGATEGGRIIPLDTRFQKDLNSFSGLENLSGLITIPVKTDGTNALELKDLGTGEMKQRWIYDKKYTPVAVSFTDMTLIAHSGRGFQDSTDMLVKLSQKGEELWAKQISAHHTLHVDSKGRIYTPIIMPPHPKNTLILKKYRDDGYAILSPEGEVIAKKSITDILISNNLGYLIYGVGAFEWDAIHLNAVKPAEKSTAFWEKGDLLMSARHLSLVFLYRPSTNTVIWHSAGPWLNQHDPDFIGDHRISVFGNDVVSNVYNRTKKTDVHFLTKRNVIYVHDFKTGKTNKHFETENEKIGLRTVTGGSHSILDDGSLFMFFHDLGLGALYNKDKHTIHHFGFKVDHDKIRVGEFYEVYNARGNF